MLEIRDLRLEDEDFVLDGDMRLVGDTKIENGSLIVSGDLVLAETEECLPSLEIIGGNLTAGSLWTEDKMGRTPQEQICTYFHVDGDIHITNGAFYIGECEIVHADDIIIEDGDLVCGGIAEASSLYVSGDIDSSDSINVLFDIFCHSAEVYGATYCGRDLYAEDYYDTHKYIIFVKGSFKTNDLYNPGQIEIG